MALEELERRKSKSSPVVPDISADDAIKELERRSAEGLYQKKQISPVEAQIELAERGVESISEKDLLRDPKWISNSKKVYELNEGADAEPLSSDREYAKYGMNYMGWFNYNIPKMGLEAAQLTNATDEQRQAFVDLMEDYDRKEISLAGTGRFAAGVLTDPSTYVGIGTFGSGLVAREATKQATKEGIKMGVKQSLKEGLKQGAKVAAIEGAVYGAVDNSLRQSAKIQAGRQDGFDFGENIKAAGFGGLVGGTLGAGVGAVAGAIRGKKLQQEVADAEIKLAEDQTVSIGKEVAPYSEELASRIDDEIGATLPEGYRPSAKIDLHKEAVDIGVKVLAKMGKTIAPDEKVSDQIFEAVQLTPHIPEYKDAFAEVLKDTGITLTELAQNLRLDVSNAGRTLQQYSTVSKDIARISDEIAGLAPPDPMGPKIIKAVRDADNIRRGLMVSAPATAMRQMTAQIGRVGMHTLTDIYDNVLNATFNPLRKAFGAEVKPVDFSQSFGLLLNLTKNVKKAKDVTDFALKYNDYSKHRLFNNYVSDVGDATTNTTFNRAQKFTDALNVFNRMQEYYYRRGMFSASLDKILREKGFTVQDMLDAGDNAFKRIDGKEPMVTQKDLEKATDDALDFTYAKVPDNALMQGFVKLANSVPFGTTALIPFARFMANAMAFQFKHSPLGVTALLKPSEIKKIVSGDYKTLSQAAIGSAALLAAIEAKREGITGDERWYEIRVGDKTYDMRAYFPLTPYFLVADVIVRSERGLPPPDAKEVLQGLTGAQFRAGVGFRLVDDFIDDLRGLGSTTKINEAIANFVTDTLTPYLTPIRTFADFIEPFRGEEARKYRDRTAQDGGFLETIGRGFQAQIPFAKEMLPEAESPTRAAAPGRPEKVGPLPAGIAKQLLGITAREEKNPAEREFDRLGFKRRDILPYSGDKKVDRIMSKNLGPAVELVISALVESDEYQSLSNPEKSVTIRKYLTPLRASAKLKSMREDPEAFLKNYIKRLPKDKRLILFNANPQLEDFVRE